MDGRNPYKSICCPPFFSVVSVLFSHLTNTSQANPRNPPPHLVIVSSDTHLQALFPERKLEKILSVMHTEASSAEKEFDRCRVSRLFDAYIVIKSANLTPVVDGNPQAIVNYVTLGS
jgi:hypothetical protein